VKEFDQYSNPSSDTTTNQVFSGMVDLHAPEVEGRSYLDLTGRFPAKSQDGNLYVLILYTYNNNAILVEPLKNRTDGKQLAAYSKIRDRWPMAHHYTCTGWTMKPWWRSNSY
jgi:hypothetical protein